MSAPTKVTAKVRDMGKRPDIEAMLDELEVLYTYEYAYSTHEFDFERSEHNQGRTKSIEPELIERYTEAVTRGDRFPAVVANRFGRDAKGKLIIVDGNHRLRAHDAAGQPIDVYILDPATEPQVIGLLTHLFNTRHGMPTSDDERVQAAVHMVGSGMKIKDAAAMLNVPASKVSNAMARKKLYARAKRAGVDMPRWDDLAEGSKQQLGKITEAALFGQAAELTIKSRLSPSEVTTLVKTVNSTDDHTQAQVILRHEQDRLRPRAQQQAGGRMPANAKRQAPTDKQQLNMALGGLFALTSKEPDEYASYYMAAESHDAASRVRSLIDWLEKFAVELNPDVT